MLTACAATSVEDAADKTLIASDAELKAVKKIEEPKRVLSGDIAKIRKHYLVARVAENRGDLDRALQAYEKVLAEDPLQDDARARVFSYYLSLGRIKEALSHSKYMEAEDNPSLLFLVLKAYDAAAEVDLDKAASYMDEAQKQMPRMLQLLLAKSYIAIARGADAAPVLKQLEAYTPEPNMSVYKYYHLGRMYERLGQLDKALDKYRSGYLIDNSSFALAESLSRLYLKQGKEQQAEDLINGYKRLNPRTLLTDKMKERLQLDIETERSKEELLRSDLAEVMIGLATSVSLSDLSVVGHQFLKLALFIDPNHSFANYYVGLLLEEQKEYDLAIEQYQRISSDQSAYLASRLRIAQAEFGKGNETKAIKILEKLNKKYPSREQIQQALAESYFDKQNYEKALVYYDQLLNKLSEPSLDHAGLFFARGASYERMKDLDAAVADLERALELRPNNATILNYLGYMLVDANKRVEDALLMIKRALTLRPQDGSIIDSLGWAYYKLERYEEAVRFLEIAVEHEPQDATINSHLGDVYEKLGRKLEAYHQWQKASQMMIDDEEIRVHLKQKLQANND